MGCLLSGYLIFLTLRLFPMREVDLFGLYVPLIIGMNGLQVC